MKWKMTFSTVRRKLFEFTHKRRFDLFSLLVLSLFFTILFRSGLFGGKFILIGDPLKQLYPMRMIAWGMIKEGTPPLWTPYLFAGYPLASMMMLGISYPLTWGYLFLPGHWAEQIYILAPYLLSSIFTYAYLREVGRSHIASLLGGLVFGYSGFMFSPMGLAGVQLNSALWLPLILIGVERARKRPFLPCLLLTTVAYTMSVLAGSAQIVVYVGLLVLAYGIFLFFVPDDDDGSETADRSLWRRMRPLTVNFCSIALSAGVSAFQILETRKSANLSVRNDYPYNYFTEGSFPFALAWRSLLEPLGNFWDSSTFAPLLAVCLAIVAIISAFLFRPHFRGKVFFWGAVAVIAWLLILGNNTPLFNIYLQIPLVSRFRYPSRHSLEWTFAIGVLAAYGWDVIEARIRRKGEIKNSGRASSLLRILLGGVCLLIGGIASFYWWRYTVESGLGKIYDINNTIKNLHYPYLGWKIVFTVSIIAALSLFYKVANRSAQMGLLAATIAFYCFVEPYIWIIKPVAIPFGVDANLFDNSFGGATRFLQQIQNERNGRGRNFTLMHPYECETSPGRNADAVNWTALAGIEDLNGYESLIMQRYSVALRNVPWGTVVAEPFIYFDKRLLEPRSHVLDLLNTRFITSFSSRVHTFSEGELDKDGVGFNTTDLEADLKTTEPFSLEAGAMEADTLVLVTAMGNSGRLANDTPVAKISVHTTDGRIIDRYLLAGVGTSEWAHDSPYIKSTVRHALAPVYDSIQHNGFHTYRFMARMDLGGRLKVDRIDIVKLTDSASVVLWKASLYDSTARKSRPLPYLFSKRWRKVYEKDGATILENLRALPRAWLVPKAETPGTEEILRRIRGESEVPFNPLNVALVEVEPHKAPALSGEPLSADSYARIVTYEPNRIVMETKSDKQAMLVVSEMHYPGWVATIDGVRTPIHTTNFLLRGIVAPAGLHRVEMEYRSPGLRSGAIISLFTLLLIGALAVYAKRKTMIGPSAS